MKVLSSLLGVNQKASANTEEMNKFLNNFEQLVYNRENIIFGKNLNILRDVFELESSSSIDSKENKAPKMWDSIFKSIFAFNKQLDSNSGLDKEHIKSILRKANKVSVNYTNANGERDTKIVSLIGGQFDNRYYIDKDNVEYRKASKEYYNLIKNTFNVFDVIENVPHIKEMIDSVVLSHNMIINSSIMYNFVFSSLKDTVRENSSRIVFSDKEMNTNVKNQMGNINLPPRIGKAEVPKSILGLHIISKDKWLKSEATKDLTFNIKELMKLSGVNEISLYTSDDARNIVPGSTSKDIVLVKLDDDTNPIVSLDTNYGIANFKKITEELLLPILQKSKNNVLTDSFKVETMTNILGIRGNAITSTFSLSSLDNPVSIEKFQELLIEFNNLDVQSEVTGLLKNSEGKTIKWRDALYVYNLLVNNEKNGDKRLTPLFQDYAKRIDTLGYDYINYWSKIDSGKVDLFDYKEKLNQDSDYLTADSKKQSEMESKAKQEVTNDILFYTFHTKGEMYIKSNGSTAKLQVTNPDFVVVTSMTETPESKRKSKELNELIKLIKTGGFITKFKCD